MAIIATSEGQRATGMKMRRSLGRCRIAIASVCAGSPFQDIPALADTPALPAAAARAAAREVSAGAAIAAVTIFSRPKT